MTPQDVRVLLAGSATAALAVAIASGVGRPPASRHRWDTYLEPWRLRKGLPPRKTQEQRRWSTFEGAFWSLLARSGQFGADAGASSDEHLRRRLAAANLPLDVDQYRARSFRWAVSAAVGLAVGLGLATGNGLVSMLGLPIGALLGVSAVSSQVDRSIRHRREAMRLELYPVLLRLAFHLGTHGRVLEAVEDMARRGRGEVVADLRSVLAATRAGESIGSAFAAQAIVCPEPLAARAWRAIAVGERRGAELSSHLLGLAGDARREVDRARREESTKRRFVMMTVTVVVMSPVLVVLIAAPLGRLVFGVAG